MPNTFELIAATTVGSGGASTIDFTSIPSTFTDLCLKVSLRDTRSNVANGLVIRFNGSSSSFTSRVLEGSGSSGYSFNDTQGLVGENNSATSTATTFASTDIYIPNYAGTTWNKSFSFDSVTENNATTAYADLGAGLWAATNAITSISLACLNSASFVQYSTAYLYGVKNA
jgi:hypothetical protein